jgi:organic radical activating enzyme
MSLRKQYPSDREVMDLLNKNSTSLCLAKWYNATIWLGSGQTTSCHHPPSHAVPIEFVKKNPKLLHNTDEKKQDRTMMLHGLRPKGCEYCWKIEDMGTDAISDRVYKSAIYEMSDLENAVNSLPGEDFNLRTLEIAFDRVCQFACSYCNPAFSTTWVNDIEKNGPYKGLTSDGRGHFIHSHPSAQLFKPEESNPYIDAFFAWWESDLGQSLNELRVTGGEPLMSAHTWKLLDWFANHDTEMRFALNSNMGMQQKVLDKFIKATHNIKHFMVYTSNESVGKHAEYIRDGLDYSSWLDNINQLLTKGNVENLSIMCTINALCLESLPQFLDEILKLKIQYGKLISFSLNILRFPSFQSPLVLPDNLREQFKNNLQEWLQSQVFMDKQNSERLLHQMEINQLQRLIDYLDIVKTPHSEAFDLPTLRNDFKQFYTQYDSRRGKNFAETFPIINEWYKTL